MMEAVVEAMMIVWLESRGDKDKRACGQNPCGIYLYMFLCCLSLECLSLEFGVTAGSRRSQRRDQNQAGGKATAA
jgi:hypothetical protein